MMNTSLPPPFQFCPATITVFAVHQTRSWCFTYKSGVCPKTKALSPDTNTCLHSLEMYVSGGSTEILYVSEIKHLFKCLRNQDMGKDLEGDKCHGKILRLWSKL